MSALPPKADIGTQSRNGRFVPKADIGAMPPRRSPCAHWLRVDNRGKRRVTIWRFLQLLGAACLLIVVLTHVAEAFRIFPALGWGLPNSAGHYLDLASAILGCTLLLLGFIGSALTRCKNSN